MNQEITVVLDESGRVVKVYESDSKRRCEFHVLYKKQMGWSGGSAEFPPPDVLDSEDYGEVNEFLREAGPEHRKRVFEATGEQWPTDFGEVDGDEG